MICVVTFTLLLLLNSALCLFNFRENASSWKFYKQLEQIPIYYLKDKNGNIIKNAYKTLGSGVVGSNAWSPSRYRDSSKAIEWDIKIDFLPASIVPFFAEEELAQAYANELGKGSRVVKTSLADYLRWSEKWKTDTCILLPNRAALELCTKSSTFTGTPFFITNPPIAVSVKGKRRGYAFFPSHSYALDIYNLLLSGKQVIINGMELSLEFYPSFSDKLKSFLGFSQIKLEGFNTQHFKPINCNLVAVSVETLSSLIHNYPELESKVIIITNKN